ncbi:dual specificity protein phosphatase 14-like protein [Dinothrombium tinctorium]|uniref:Dual specificity protein phosphatase 14-like protein n=1 Tax=Dinothrombium tinctorium TaxID=1965070 RepID=A0A3S3QJA6_9ACAR|nr:dual specificity protein phosphatase 14-like protein [Dinothrombium tinctorium]
MSRYEWLPTKEELTAFAEAEPEEEHFRYSGVFAEVSMITNSLGLTGVGGLTQENFERHQFNCVISAAPEREFNPQNIDYIKIDVYDEQQSDLSQYFDMIADKISEVESNGGKTLIHCMAGVSRSSTLVIAYLIKHRRMTLREALIQVKQKRSCVRPINAFLKQLMQFEKQVLGTNSIHMSISLKMASKLKHLISILEENIN